MRPHAIDFTNSVDMTEQSHKKECDINYIMRKFQKTGIIDHVREHEGEYMDIPAVDFRQAQETILTATQMFADLPSQARKKFDNDPAKFLEYVQDPKNKNDLHTMGLLDPYYEPPTDAPKKDKEGDSKGSKATSNGGGDSEAAKASEKG